MDIWFRHFMHCERETDRNSQYLLKIFLFGKWSTFWMNENSLYNMVCWNVFESSCYCRNGHWGKDLQNRSFVFVKTRVSFFISSTYNSIVTHYYKRLHCYWHYIKGKDSILWLTGLCFNVSCKQPTSNLEPSNAAIKHSYKQNPFIHCFTIIASVRYHYTWKQSCLSVFTLQIEWMNLGLSFFISRSVSLSLFL